MIKLRTAVITFALAIGAFIPSVSVAQPITITERVKLVGHHMEQTREECGHEPYLFHNQHKRTISVPQRKGNVKFTNVQLSLPASVIGRLVTDYGKNCWCAPIERTYNMLELSNDNFGHFRLDLAQNGVPLPSYWSCYNPDSVVYYNIDPEKDVHFFLHRLPRPNSQGCMEYATLKSPELELEATWFITE